MSNQAPAVFLDAIERRHVPGDATVEIQRAAGDGAIKLFTAPGVGCQVASIRQNRVRCRAGTKDHD